jgi:hypothetical protein
MGSPLRSINLVKFHDGFRAENSRFGGLQIGVDGMGVRSVPSIFEKWEADAVLKITKLSFQIPARFWPPIDYKKPEYNGPWS